MKWEDKDLDGLHELFRAKMHEVYRKNRKVEIFGDSMAAEFNAWQGYLRNSLKLFVKDREAGADRPEVVTDKDRKVWIKILNPSNGASFSNEMIFVPKELAEKIMVLGSLPEEL